jgi:hypothetical protein
MFKAALDFLCELYLDPTTYLKSDYGFV